MPRKPKQYEVIAGYSRSGTPNFAVRISGVLGARGYVGATWGDSKVDEREINRLVAQANEVFDRANV